jgi:hypothetical protein
VAKHWIFASLLLSGCALRTPQEWLPVVDRERSIKVLADNSKNLLQAKDLTKIQSGIESLMLRPVGAESVTIYKFNTSKLCGIGGCLYAVYRTNSNKLLFQILLDSTATIGTSDNCLVFSQPDLKNIKQLRYCYQKSEYVQQAITTIAK